MDMSEIKSTQATVTICSQSSMDTQSPAPMPLPNAQVHVPLLNNTSERPLSTCQHEHIASPAMQRRFANPVPLGCCAFALTSFVFNCTNLYMIGKATPSTDIGLAMTYGGMVQVLAGMWEMALGNTFGATSFGSYGAYWITIAMYSRVDAGAISSDAGDRLCQKEISMGLFMIAWFIFTTLMLLCTLKSSLAMFLLFFFLDLNYLLLGITHLHCGATSRILASIQKTGGVCGLLAAITAWYNAFAWIFDPGTGLSALPLGQFPWATAVPGQQAKFKEV